MSHLDFIRLRLASYRDRLAVATSARDRQWLTLWIEQEEKEERAELAFLASRGLTPAVDDDITADELAAELS